MTSAEGHAPGLRALLGYLLLGAAFGLVLVQSEAVSWFRIQEMFRLRSFHMYGLLGSGVAVAMASLAVLRRLRPADPDVELAPKRRTPGLVRYWAGGTVFGLGWALLGACPGPLYTLVGAGVTVYLVALAAAVLGTWVYGLARPHLPH